MVGWLSYGKRRFEAQDARMRRLIPPLHAAMKRLVPMIDADTEAFDDYMAALRLPEHDPKRPGALQAGLRKAVSVPLEVMRIGDGCWSSLKELAEHGNPASRSDLEVGAKALETGIWGAGRNVLINLPGLDEGPFEDDTRREVEALTERARDGLRAVLDALASRG
jgi:glutamate formiminotransferase/formiminotetrahydrofolate cyclodeaminase